MRTLYLLCGLSFAGKSTLREALVAARPLVVIGFDDLNRERGLHAGGLGLPSEAWAGTTQEAHRRFRAISASGAGVLVDDTNCFRWLRDDWRRLAAELGYRTRIIYLDTPLAELHRRRAQNELTLRRAPILEDVFELHLRTFEPPGVDEDVLTWRVDDSPSEWIDRHLPQGGRAAHDLDTD